VDGWVGGCHATTLFTLPLSEMRRAQISHPHKQITSELGTRQENKRLLQEHKCSIGNANPANIFLPGGFHISAQIDEHAKLAWMVETSDQ